MLESSQSDETRREPHALKGEHTSELQDSCSSLSWSAVVGRLLAARTGCAIQGTPAAAGAGAASGSIKRSHALDRWPRSVASEARPSCCDCPLRRASSPSSSLSLGGSSIGRPHSGERAASTRQTRFAPTITVIRSEGRTVSTSQRMRAFRGVGAPQLVRVSGKGKEGNDDL